MHYSWRSQLRAVDILRLIAIAPDSTFQQDGDVLEILAVLVARPSFLRGGVRLVATSATMTFRTCFGLAWPAFQALS
jgi:hypothetical protein